MTLDRDVRKARLLIYRAERDYKVDPMRCRLRLEMAERLLDDASLRIGLTRNMLSNPYLEYFERIYDGWRYLRTFNNVTKSINNQ
jgi:hypothetical protein